MTNPSDEKDAPRMTEAEWRQREAQRECAISGHYWNITQSFDGTPVALACERPCGTPWYRVLPPDTRDEPVA